LQQFKKFFNTRVSLLETLELSSKKTNKLKRVDCTKSKSFLIQKQRYAVCNETHRVQHCPKFLELNQERIDCLRKAGYALTV